MYIGWGSAPSGGGRAGGHAHRPGRRSGSACHGGMPQGGVRSAPAHPRQAAPGGTLPACGGGGPGGCRGHLRGGDGCGLRL